MVGNYFTKDYVRSQLESYEFSEDVMVSDKENGHIFELTVNSFKTEYKERIEKDFEMYYAKVDESEKYDGSKYYKIFIGGLIG